MYGNSFTTASGKEIDAKIVWGRELRSNKTCQKYK